MRTFVAAVVALIILCGTFTTSLACQCGGGIDSTTDFFSSTFWVWDTSISRTIIIKAQFTGVRNGYGAQLKILETYFGKPTSLDTVTVWGSSGSDCRRSIPAIAQPGDTLIVGLLQLNDAGPNFIETVDDYYLWKCNLAYLHVRGDSVYGGAPLSFTSPSFPLKMLEDSLRNRASVIPLALKNVTNGIDPYVSLYPNPVTDILHLLWRQGSTEGIVLTVRDASGRAVLIKSSEELDRAGNNELVLSVNDLSPGIYFVTLNSKWGMRTIKMVVAPKYSG